MSNINTKNNNLEPVGCYNNKLNNKLYKIDHKNNNFTMNDCINHANDNKYLCNKGESSCQYFSYNKSTKECLVGGKILDDIELEKYNKSSPCNNPIYITPEVSTNNGDPYGTLKSREKIAIEKRLKELEKLKKTINTKIDDMNINLDSIKFNKSVDQILKDKKYKNDIEKSNKTVNKTFKSIDKNKNLNNRLITTIYTNNNLINDTESNLNKSEKIIKENIKKIVDLNNEISTLNQQITQNNEKTNMSEIIIKNMKLILGFLFLGIIILTVLIGIKYRSEE